MALVNQSKREINAKIVFFGPGLAGKATNLKHVYSKLKPEFRGPMKAMTVQDARMLFFNFTPPGDGNVHGFKVRFHVYTVSGAVVDPVAWKMVLKGADGVVFVADADKERQDANRESLESLALLLNGYGQSLSSIPVVFQFNKSDLPDAEEVVDMERMLNPSRLPSYQASSQNGEGVLQTLLGLVKTVLAGLRSKGIEEVAATEGLQRVIETPDSTQVRAFDRGAIADTAEAGPPPQETAPETRDADSRQPALSNPEEAFVKAAPPEEPLSLELSGAPQAAEPGVFRVPLVIRSGSRSKSVVLNLRLSLEEG